ncbi:hypothetical protein [Halorubrum salsamenti]|uniref:hypothetical protein n=1 Tax=Halorubrum salsamenti TaxID=2583990 RepID=UPI0011A2A286|nr:hypothetical protein [Halorubrum salsamenti]
MDSEAEHVPWLGYGLVWTIGSMVFSLLWWVILLMISSPTGGGGLLLVGGVINALVVGLFLFYVLSDLLIVSVDDDVLTG